ncbi:MAG TPA: caspase family protein [Thermoanaerobaculia bacterium]|jgi:hypothetical protein|nr:caspase family protein [Thermoanaerobaculia bacterium]
MPDRNFHPLDKETFKLVLEKFPLRRKIDTVHLHHTWRPNHAQYRGIETIQAMWRVHTEENGWSDIAQHVSIAPDGTIWTGRDWNQSPASAKGFNGNANVGPFMIEMIGDFDRGRDRLEGKQREAVLWVIACVQARCGLAEKSLRFHNEMSTKTCPGTSVVYDELVKELREVKTQLKDAATTGARSVRPFDDRALAIQAVLDDLSPAGSREILLTPADAELTEADIQGTRSVDFFGAALDSGLATARAGNDGDVDSRMLAELAPYMIDLNQGRFSIAGKARTKPGDVDRIFDDSLEREVEQARLEKRPVRVMLYAHGGLVSEEGGIATAHKQVAWWRANGVYPIHFVWETGLAETLRSFLPFAGQRGIAPRGITDLTDRLIEQTIHLPGEKVWSGMKRSAERSVDPIPAPQGTPRPEDGGGITYVVQKLLAFCQRHAGTSIELHAVGHSAGSIFHSYLLPAALNLGVPGFTSTQFLAPAITTSEFFARLAGLMGKGTGPMTIYTMKKALELDDNCALIYRKSLLYLIFYALEAERETPLLGLEESLRGDRELQRLFSLDGRTSGLGEVVWSDSPAASGRNASRSHHHGDFDDDVPTMDSVLRRVLGVNDTAQIRSYAEFRPQGAGRGISDPWLAPSTSTGQTDLMALLQPALAAGVSGVLPQLSSAAAGAANRSASRSVLSGGGRYRALCVGIDRYPTAPLGGCVADARLWASTLSRLGFEDATLLLDEQATRGEILDALRRMVGEGRRGDVLVFQYSGHGTQLPDLNGDEDDSKDEAFCPFDFASGAFLIDDDVREVFDGIPDGVNLTCFVDSCNSGSITRVAVGGPLGSPGDPTARRRFVIATPEMVEAHRDFRGRLGFSRGLKRGQSLAMREITFSACQPFEVAWEMQGQGEFTRRATRILSAGIQGLTNADFQQRVEAAFGPDGRQHPFLDCASGAKTRGLLLQIGGAAAETPPGAGPQGLGFPVAAGLPASSQEGVANLLRSIATLLS